MSDLRECFDVVVFRGRSGVPDRPSIEGSLSGIDPRLRSGEFVSYVRDRVRDIAVVFRDGDCISRSAFRRCSSTTSTVVGDVCADTRVRSHSEVDRRCLDGGINVPLKPLGRFADIMDPSAWLAAPLGDETAVLK
jgi:hypothetical protein